MGLKKNVTRDFKSGGSSGSDAMPSKLEEAVLWMGLPPCDNFDDDNDVDSDCKKVDVDRPLSHKEATPVHHRSKSVCSTTPKRSMSKESSPIVHRCNECNQTFSRPYRLRNHQRKVHGDQREVTVVPTPFQCPEDGCNKSFGRKDHLQRHQRTHLAVMPYACHHFDCGKTFSTAQKLTRHMKSHTNQTLMCETCGQYFKQEHRLDVHRALCHTGETLECPHDDCTRTFKGGPGAEKTFWLHLQRHKYRVYPTEIGQRKYGCHQCSLRFKTRDAYLEHKNEAHPPQRFSCDYCHKTYKSQSNLDAHVDSVHNALRYHCNVEGCGRGYVSLFNLRQHMRTAHEKIKRFQCEICKKRWTHKQNWTNHVCAGAPMHNDSDGSEENEVATSASTLKDALRDTSTLSERSKRSSTVSSEAGDTAYHTKRKRHPRSSEDQETKRRRVEDDAVSLENSYSSDKTCRRRIRLANWNKVGQARGKIRKHRLGKFIGPMSLFATTLDL